MYMRERLSIGKNKWVVMERRDIGTLSVFVLRMDASSRTGFLCLHRRMLNKEQHTDDDDEGTSVTNHENEISNLTPKYVNINLSAKICY